jgi:hypothetical protein
LPKPARRKKAAPQRKPARKPSRRASKRLDEFARFAVPDAYAKVAVEAVMVGHASALRILHNPNHPAFASVWGKTLERAYGKPSQPIVGDPTKPVTIRILRDE